MDNNCHIPDLVQVFATDQLKQQFSKNAALSRMVN